MAQNKVMKLWTAIVTAFLALCTTLGLITTTTTAAVAESRPVRNCTASAALPATAALAWSFARSLPPTMKQRIGAEAHGSSPSCRHRSPADTDAESEADPETDTDAETAAQPLS
ncbi:DUF6344 domain-containing protein [Streptomyces sp. NBC_00576]|uniref:DUF6344 domain-containing protein n=1 Tax=Streptomyces sp. NBC_00576 TaxID=2903665 RepID=UPI002E81F4D7|nr:DUF6344 domain-containing protein [Streptomyces sp. NBC_00576]WUB72737.1 DUF6344 domain-containing protein [Streptomyces sp. NBC_00576]